VDNTLPLQCFDAELKYQFKDLTLLQSALTHPSYTAECSRCDYDNQRLEFLGDAVLHLEVAELLFIHHPEMDEGELTRRRSALTNEAAFAELATMLNLGNYLRLGRGECQEGGRQRPSILADAFEAVVGALYLDAGKQQVRELLLRLCGERILATAPLLPLDNPKGALQELIQEQMHISPQYRVKEITGPQHIPEFTVAVIVGDTEIAVATAGSRKNAEKAAALIALQKLREQIHAPTDQS